MTETVSAYKSVQAKAAFIARYSVLGNISAACRELGIGRQTVYDWQQSDPDFVEAMKRSQQEALEYLEHVAWSRATEGVAREKREYYRGRLVDTHAEQHYSDVLLIFLLKALAPEKYRERYDFRHSGGLELKDLGALLQQREERTIENTRVSPALPEPSHTIENVDTEEPFYRESEPEEADDDA